MRIGWLLLVGGLAAGQPASDRFRSAICAQETSGELDSAIRLYQQVLRGESTQRVYAPQAQFRLGQYLLRKGDQRGASAVLQAVIREYPEDTALVARAREALPVGEELLPKPRPDREIGAYRWTIPVRAPTQEFERPRARFQPILDWSRLR